MSWEFRLGMPATYLSQCRRPIRNADREYDFPFVRRIGTAITNVQNEIEAVIGRKSQPDSKKYWTAVVGTTSFEIWVNQA